MLICLGKRIMKDGTEVSITTKGQTGDSIYLNGNVVANIQEHFQYSLSNLLLIQGEDTKIEILARNRMSYRVSPVIVYNREGNKLLWPSAICDYLDSLNIKHFSYYNNGDKFESFLDSNVYILSDSLDFDPCLDDYVASLADANTQRIDFYKAMNFIAESTGITKEKLIPVYVRLPNSTRYILSMFLKLNGDSQYSNVYLVLSNELYVDLNNIEACRLLKRLKIPFKFYLPGMFIFNRENITPNGLFFAPFSSNSQDIFSTSPIYPEINLTKDKENRLEIYAKLVCNSGKDPNVTVYNPHIGEFLSPEFVCWYLAINGIPSELSENDNPLIGPKGPRVYISADTDLDGTPTVTEINTIAEKAIEKYSGNFSVSTLLHMPESALNKLIAEARRYYETLEKVRFIKINKGKLKPFAPIFLFFSDDPKIIKYVSLILSDTMFYPLAPEMVVEILEFLGIKAEQTAFEIVTISGAKLDKDDILLD